MTILSPKRTIRSPSTSPMSPSVSGVAEAAELAAAPAEEFAGRGEVAPVTKKAAARQVTGHLVGVAVSVTNFKLTRLFTILTQVS